MHDIPILKLKVQKIIRSYNWSPTTKCLELSISSWVFQFKWAFITLRLSAQNISNIYVKCITVWQCVCFVILVSECHAILTKWNIKYKEIFWLSADGAGALFYFLLLANFVDGASAYVFTFISIFFSNEGTNPKTFDWVISGPFLTGWTKTLSPKLGNGCGWGTWFTFGIRSLTMCLTPKMLRYLKSDMMDIKKNPEICDFS